MTKSKHQLDPVKLAKEVSKLTKVPLPRVAQVFQRYPLDGPGLTKAYDECVKLGVEEMKKTLNVAFGF
jgi:hypothetical protein